jgi:hypothetical protein
MEGKSPSYTPSHLRRRPKDPPESLNGREQKQGIAPSVLEIPREYIGACCSVALFKPYTAATHPKPIITSIAPSAPCCLAQQSLRYRYRCSAARSPLGSGNFLEPNHGFCPLAGQVTSRFQFRVMLHSDSPIVVAVLSLQYKY